MRKRIAHVASDPSAYPGFIDQLPTVRPFILPSDCTQPIQRRLRICPYPIGVGVLFARTSSF
jgi:hypothetical protein